jgi:phosphoribosyl 1,2-cyclic phosphate phosphodiesterase
VVKVIFLGTGTSQGVPVISCQCRVCNSPDPKDKKLRSSIMVQTDKVHFIIDTGPDFRQQMLREKITRLDAVIFTHGHKDHTAGFDDVRGFNFTQKKAMDVYLDELVEETIRNDYRYCFTENKYPGIPELKLHPIDSKNSFDINGEKIIPIKVMHHRLPVLGFRIQDFTYITDANYISKEEKAKIKGSKVMVLNALRKESHISHFTLNQAIELIDELKIEKAYLTHQSHNLGLFEEVSKELPDHVYLAYDGLKLEL